MSLRRSYTAGVLRKVALLMIGACLLEAQAHSATQLFQFRNGFWINLHHYLYAEALTKATQSRARISESAKQALASAPCPAFTSEQQQAWNDALDFYTATFGKRDILFDAELVRINDLLGEAGDSASPPAGLDNDLARALAEAAPAYREHCWPKHRRLNQNWIESFQRLLQQHGAAMASRLSKIYQTTWPETIPVDVVMYSNWAGAYTTTTPAHITFSSGTGKAANDDLETIFHESSHVLIDARVQPMLRDAFMRQHSELVQGLDHMMIFFTAGVVAKDELAKVDPGYAPFAYRAGIYKRDKYFTQDEAVLRRFWLPYLEGKQPIRESLDEIAHAICCEEQAH